MDNSLATYKKKIEEMIEEIEKFSDALNHHVIIEPREALEDAVRAGFPSDIASNYLHHYYSRNESDAQDIMRYIKSDCIPYLSDVAFYVESAMNRGGAVSTNKSTGGASTSQQGKSGSSAILKNYRDIENSLGIKRGIPMSIEEADKQNANPNLVDEYIEDAQGGFVDPITGVRYRKNPAYDSNEKSKYEPFTVNCATCATAYALRLRGFDVKAKGNVGGSGSLNEKISSADAYLDVWRNQDGSKVKLSHTDDWMKTNNIQEMTIDDYKAYFEDVCKEQGVYVVMVRWKDSSSGHATILQRDTDGILYYIEPQRYERSKGENGKRSLDDLLMTSTGKQKLSLSPTHGYGVLRVDNKIFNTEYSSLFETNKNE